MPRTSDARDRAINATAKLLRRQGYAATGLNEILEESGSPKGSFYFHFPGGKEQLATESIHSAGTYVAHMIETALDGADSAEHGIRRVARMFGAWMEQSGYTEGCPVTTVALETLPGSGPLAEACSSALCSWEETMERFLINHGYAEDRAAALATVSLCSLEGAFIMSRTQMSRRPFERAADALAELL